MKTTLIGAGAIGGMIASRLARSDAPVSLLVRPGQAVRLREQGLRMRENGEVHTTRHQVATDAAELGVQDLVIISVKAPALVQAATRFAPLIGPDTVILSALNGIPWWFFEGFEGPLRGRRLRSVDPAGEIARALPPEQSVGCVVYLAAYVDVDGIVCPSPGEKLVLGDAMPGTGSLLRAERIASLLRKAGFAPEIAKSIQREVWIKLWGNLTANPIGALTGSTIEGMLHNQYTLRLVASMMAEARALANYLGLDLGMDIPQRMQGMRRLVGVKSSMLQDIEAGRALELDTIIGAVSEIGDLAGIDTPFIDAVLGLIQQRAGNAGLWKPPEVAA